MNNPMDEFFDSPSALSLASVDDLPREPKKDAEPKAPVVELDPSADRNCVFTMKVNDYEKDLMARCASVKRVGKSALIRHLLDEFAKEKGLF